jgi:1-deoxy-D-xylulose-5-phosphate reductoisomerase
VRRVIVLGSSGSIGTQALDVIRANPELVELVGLATGSQEHVLREQAAEFGVAHTALGAEEAARLVRDVEADVVLNGITGSVGLGPTLAALETGRTLALANKESLIVGSSPSTRNTPRSRRRCAADPPTRSGAWSSRPRGARSAGAPGSPSSVSRPRRR